ncbi:MAG TPA: energy transducer TonB, partial [Labilithrix sp.]|nr:energy transducer TonB [Labilithrix sp.]
MPPSHHRPSPRRFTDARRTRSATRLARRNLAVIAAIVAAASTRIEPASAQSPADASAIVPPQLVESVEPSFPPAARAAGHEGTVVLRLDIDAEGRVTRAEVQQSANPELDEAARLSALRLRFAPARRGDRAIAARILHRYDFRIPDAAPPDAATREEVPVADTPAPAPLPAAPAPEAPAEVTVHG